MIYPGLHPAMLPAARKAERLGLYLTHYNSGVARNPLNGFRVFWGDAARDFFAGNHLAHLRTQGEVEIYLQGYADRDRLGPGPMDVEPHTGQIVTNAQGVEAESEDSEDAVDTISPGATWEVLEVSDGKVWVKTVVDVASWQATVSLDGFWDDFRAT